MTSLGQRNLSVCSDYTIQNGQLAVRFSLSATVTAPTQLVSWARKKSGKY